VFPDSVYEFHHRDPNEKDFTIGNCLNKRWETIKSELDKCDLVCANCHRLGHSDRETELWGKEVAAYQGRYMGG